MTSRPCTRYPYRRCPGRELTAVPGWGHEAFAWQLVETPDGLDFVSIL